MHAMLTSLISRIAAASSGSVVFVLLAGAAVFVFSLGVFALVSTATDPRARRLGKVAREQSTSQPVGARFAARVRTLSALALPKRMTERTRVSQQLIIAGYRSATALRTFYGAKALLITALPLAVLLAWPLFPTTTPRHLLIYALAAGTVGFLLPSMWLDRRVLHRQRTLRAAFPDALDLLVVCVEAGLGLAPALQRVANEVVVSHPELGEELALVNAEMRAGVDRAQALKNLAERTGLADIRGLVTLMVQTLRFGTSIADALRVYAEEFRDKRMQAAEEQAATIGTKMIFPLVLCLFPSFFLVAVGPAILMLISAFSHIMHH